MRRHDLAEVAIRTVEVALEHMPIALITKWLRKFISEFGTATYYADRLTRTR